MEAAGDEISSLQLELEAARRVIETFRKMPVPLPGTEEEEATYEALHAYDDLVKRLAQD